MGPSMTVRARDKDTNPKWWPKWGRLKTQTTCFSGTVEGKDFSISDHKDGPVRDGGGLVEGAFLNVGSLRTTVLESVTNLVDLLLLCGLRILFKWCWILWLIYRVSYEDLRGPKSNSETRRDEFLSQPVHSDGWFWCVKCRYVRKWVKGNLCPSINLGDPRRYTPVRF